MAREHSDLMKRDVTMNTTLFWEQMNEPRNEWRWKRSREQIGPLVAVDSRTWRSQTSKSAEKIETFRDLIFSKFKVFFFLI